MTEQELKDKIIADIIPIIETADEFMIIETMGEKPSAIKVAERIADALIAAGIGDIREAEHRAEVYYEALLSAAAYGDTPPDHYIEQAEKEFAEEQGNGEEEI